MFFFLVTERFSFCEHVSASYTTNKEFHHSTDDIDNIDMINEDETTDLKEAADTKEDKKTYISDQYDVTQTCTIETECETDKNDDDKPVTYYVGNYYEEEMILIMSIMD